jgi:hypothetical protein
MVKLKWTRSRRVATLACLVLLSLLAQACCFVPAPFPYEDEHEHWHHHHGWGGPRGHDRDH